MHVLGIRIVHGSMDRTIFLDLHMSMRKGREGKDIIPIYVVHVTNVHMNHCMYSLHIILHTRRGDILCHWLLRGVMLM